MMRQGLGEAGRGHDRFKWAKAQRQIVLEGLVRTAWLGTGLVARKFASVPDLRRLCYHTGQSAWLQRRLFMAAMRQW